MLKILLQKLRNSQAKYNMNKKTKNFSDLSKKQKDKIISDCCEGANEEQEKLLLELIKKEKEEEKDIEQAKQSEGYLFLVIKEIIRLKHKNDDEPTRANYYARGYRDGIKETIDSIIETLEEQYKQIK